VRDLTRQTQELKSQIDNSNNDRESVESIILEQEIEYLKAKDRERENKYK